jgi:hypothetical protein
VSRSVLADGNVGIGGDPAAPLCRMAALPRPGGTVPVEPDRPGTGPRTDTARLIRDGLPTAWFRWARPAADVIGDPTVAAGPRVRATVGGAGRWLAELTLW